MKPSQTPATTAVLRIFLATSITVFSTSFPVFSPRTTSRSFITFAGLKKCMPTTSCGLRVAAAHRSGTDHGDGAHTSRRCVVSHIRNLSGRALCEECVAQRLRLGRLHELKEQAALVAKSFVERFRDRSGNRVDAFQRRRV